MKALRNPAATRPKKTVYAGWKLVQRDHHRLWENYRFMARKRHGHNRTHSHRARLETRSR